MKTTKTKKRNKIKLEDYSKGVQARIAKLTRKMREAERREQAAVDYAKAVEDKRLALEKRFEKTDADYVKKFETTIQTGLEAAQKELAAAIESGDASEAQVEANKRIATLAFENAKLDQAKEGREEKQNRQRNLLIFLKVDRFNNLLWMILLIQIQELKMGCKKFMVWIRQSNDLYCF